VLLCAGEPWQPCQNFALQEEFKEVINKLAEKFLGYLLNGNLYGFEEELWKEVQQLYNKIAFTFRILSEIVILTILKYRV
jgi:hypothetical protein